MISFYIKTTKINISVWFFALVCFWMIINKEGFLLESFLFMAMHEAGHMFVMLACKQQIHRVNLLAGRLEITPRSSLASQSDMLFVLAAGACVNLLLALLFFALKMKTEMQINLVLGIFNLLPAGDLDGGRILKIILEKKFSELTAHKIMISISFAVSVMILCVGFLVIFKSASNPTLILIGLYIFITTIKNIQYTN